MSKHHVTVHLEGDTLEEVAANFDAAREKILSQVESVENGGEKHVHMNVTDGMRAKRDKSAAAQTIGDALINLGQDFNRVESAESKTNASPDCCAGTPPSEYCTSVTDVDAPAAADPNASFDERFEMLWKWLDDSPASLDRIQVGMSLFTTHAHYLESRERFEDHKRRMDKSAS